MGTYDNNDTYTTNWVGPEEFGNPWGEGVEINVADNGDRPDTPVYRVAGEVILTSGEMDTAWNGDMSSDSYVTDYRAAIMRTARAKSTGRKWGRDV
jgi:hypothetical protein